MLYILYTYFLQILLLRHGDIETNSVYKQDFVCISGMFFDPSIQEGDKNIQLDGYNLLRADHPSTSKRGGVCIFYKETLGFHIVKSLSVNVCIICEVSKQNSKAYVGVACRSLSQKSFEFEIFLSNFEKVLSDATLCNSLFTIILGDLLSGGLETKLQLKRHKLNPLQVCMGFIN